MSNLSTYSTSDKTVFKTVSEDWVVSAPVSLDTYRLLQKISHSNYLPTFEYAADLRHMIMSQLPDSILYFVSHIIDE